MNVPASVEPKTCEESVVENYQLIFNELYDALLVHVPDPKNKFRITLVDVNKSACRMLGYTKKQLLSPPSVDFVKHDKAEEESIKDIVNKLVTVKHSRFEKIFITSDGREITVDCSAVSMEYMGRPSVITIARDITEQRKITKSLEESERNFRMLAENAKDMIMRMTLSPVYKYDYVSPSATAITGYTPEEFYNDPSIGLKSVHPEDMKLFREYYELKRFDDKPVTMRWISKDGTIKWCEQLNSPIYDEQGNITGVQVIARDITDRKQVENALANEITQRRMLIEKSRDGIVILNKNGSVYEANQQFADMLGYTLEELYKLHVWEWINKFSREQMLAMLKKKKTPSTYFEANHKRKNGTIFPVEISINKTTSAGKTLIFCICRDITERKKSEEALADELTRRRILVDQSSDGIVVIDQNGKVYEANQRFAEMLGYSVEEAQQLYIFDWEYRDTPEHTLEWIRSDNESGDHFETSHRRKDGSTYDVEISTNAAIFAGQKLIFCVCRDITERKRIEAEQKALLEQLKDVNNKLEQSNRELQDFAYIASHDLREPLRKVSSFGSLLEESLSEKLSDDEKENLEFMIDGAQRMQTMIDDLLTYSRLTTKAQEPKAVDLNNIVRDLKKLELAVLLEETGGTITLLKALPTVYVEESQMRQLFQNLIGNGLKFHKPDVKPAIIIDFIEKTDGMVRIEIRDNGIGIPEEYNEQIFTMFKRLHSRDNYKGNGIGLAVCKKIVKRHGGEIGVESNQNQGSTFWFTLPRPRDP